MTEAMSKRHAAALRAALAERDRQPCDCGQTYCSLKPVVTDEYVARIVAAALAAADAHDGAPEPCPVVIGQQKGPGPGLFITCGKPHSVADHQDDDA